MLSAMEKHKWMGPSLFWICALLVVAMVLCDLLLGLVPKTLAYFSFALGLCGFSTMVKKHGLMPFLLRRSLSSLLSLLVIASLTFFLLRLLPGGPFDEEKALPPHVKANIEKKYGLDQPVTHQYFAYFKALLQGDFGYSYRYEGQPVSQIIKQTLPVSFKLGFYSLLLAFAIGVPLGLFAAAKHGTKWDSAAMIVAISGISLPSFLLAPLLIHIFSFGWPISKLFPDLYQQMLEANLLLPAALWQTPRHYILPVVALGVRPAAIIARLTRASVLDVIQSDFVRTARSKGLSERVVLYHHVLRNSLVPLLTYSGPLVAGILSGSFVIEIIFAIPGIAKFFVQGVFNRDYPMIMALTLMFSAMLILANLLVDILYKVVDPRMEVS